MLFAFQGMSFSYVTPLNKPENNDDDDELTMTMFVRAVAIAMNEHH
jgi:hypothetical protein